MRARADLVLLGILVPVQEPIAREHGRRPSAGDAKGLVLLTHHADSDGVVSAETDD